MIKHCIECGSELKEGYKYCSDCGAKLLDELPEKISHCPDCGNKIQETHKFCDNCGFKVPTKIETMPVEEKKVTEIKEPVVSEGVNETEKISKRKYGYLLIGLILIIGIAVILAAASGIFNHVNELPTAFCSVSVTSGQAPLSISFTGTGTDTDGHITSYYWTFGDGSVSTQPSPSHTYTTQGTYTATLTVTDNKGATATSSKTITVQSPRNNPPSASVSVNTYSGNAPLTVQFTGSGTDTDGYIASYSWSFGDGTSASRQNVPGVYSLPHTYTTPGTYIVTFTATDNQGGTDTHSLTITVQSVNNPPPNIISQITFTKSVDISPIVSGHGIAWDGTYLYLYDSGHVSSTNRVYQLNFDGSFTGLSWDYTGYVEWPGGITYYNGYLYMTENGGGHSGNLNKKIHKWTTGGQHITSWDISSYVSYPLSIDCNNEFLYVTDYYSPKAIHIFELSTMIHKGTISNSQYPAGFTLNTGTSCYLISNQYQSIDTLYQYYIDGTYTGWSQPFVCSSIKLIGNILVGTHDNYLNFYTVS